VSLDADAIAALAPAGLFSLAGRAAVVTGAAGGIGRWLAAGLGAAGARVLLHDLTEDALAPVAAALEEGGIECATVLADLAADGAPDAIVAAALERFGRLDVLVNCAAVNRRKPTLDVTTEDWDAVMALDLRAPFFVAQAAARAMRDAGRGGAIVNVGSVNARFALEHIAVYGPAKAGLAQVTRVMAVEWAPWGIRVNCLEPGFMETPLAAPIWKTDTARWLLNRIPFERPGQPRELVGLCLLLCSDAGSYISGQSLAADGAFLAGGRWFTPDR
jgi:NAD(P)-dependent dehydrogenase (short-subunit alcohol dehydrogenase family)